MASAERVKQNKQAKRHNEGTFDPQNAKQAAMEAREAGELSPEEFSSDGAPSDAGEHSKQVHEISDSDSGADFCGFKPIYQRRHKKRVRKDQNQPPRPSTSIQAPANQAVVNQAQAPQPQAQAPQAQAPQAQWGQAGPWQNMPMQNMMQNMNMPMPYQWPMMFPYGAYPFDPRGFPVNHDGGQPVQNDNDSSDEQSEDNEDDETNSLHEPAAPAPQNHGLKIDLQKHLKKADHQHDVGPPVNEGIAGLVEKIWNQATLKAEIKEIYDNARRPENTPSLQRVELDQEFQLRYGSKLRRMDVNLKQVHTAFLKAAVKLTHLVENVSTCEDPGAEREAIADEMIDVIRVLAYGTTQLNDVRRENVKSLIIDPDVRTRVSRNKDQNQINSSHCLFGGDISKQAKEGDFIMTLIAVICHCTEFLPNSLIWKLTKLKFLFSERDIHCGSQGFFRPWPGVLPPFPTGTSLLGRQQECQQLRPGLQAPKQLPKKQLPQLQQRQEQLQKPQTQQPRKQVLR